MLERLIDCMSTHIHVSRKSLERRFPKLRPYLAMATAKAEHAENRSSKEEDRQVRYVFKEGMYIDETWYLVEMSTLGPELHISAYDAGRERTLELDIKDEAKERLLSEAGWDYSNIAKRLRQGLVYGAEGEEARLQLA